MTVIDMKAYRDRQKLPETPLNHPLVAKKLVELMQLAAERGLPDTPKAPRANDEAINITRKPATEIPPRKR